VRFDRSPQMCYGHHVSAHTRSGTSLTPDGARYNRAEHACPMHSGMHTGTWFGMPPTGVASRFRRAPSSSSTSTTRLSVSALLRLGPHAAPARSVAQS